MKRTFKNVIMIALIILLGAAGYFTMRYIGGRGMEPGGMKEMRELPEGVQEGETPQMPEDAQEGETPQMPEDAQEGEAPQKPENMQEGQNSQVPEGMEGGEAPQQPQGMQGGGIMQIVKMALLMIESMGIVFLVLYLILSGFNKKTRKETFASKKKVVIVVLLTLVLGAAMTFATNLIQGRGMKQPPNMPTEQMEPTGQDSESEEGTL